MNNGVTEEERVRRGVAPMAPTKLAGISYVARGYEPTQQPYYPLASHYQLMPYYQRPGELHPHVINAISGGSNGLEHITKTQWKEDARSVNQTRESQVFKIAWYDIRVSLSCSQEKVLPDLRVVYHERTMPVNVMIRLLAIVDSSPLMSCMTASKLMMKAFGSVLSYKMTMAF